MNEYVHKLYPNYVLYNHAKSISESLETLLPSGDVYSNNCTGMRIDLDKNDFLVRIETYVKGDRKNQVLLVEYDTRKPQEIKVSSSVLDVEKIQEKLSIDQL